MPKIYPYKTDPKTEPAIDEAQLATDMIDIMEAGCTAAYAEKSRITAYEEDGTPIRELKEGDDLSRAHVTGLALAGRDNPLSVGWVFPPGTPRWMGLTDVTLGYYSKGVILEPDLKVAIEIYVERISALTGAKPTKPDALTAWTFDAETLPEAWPELVKAVSALLAEVG